MELILAELMKGNQDVVKYFQEAKKIWKEILPENLSDTDLVARRMDDAELKEFELKCGGNQLGKEIMGISLVALFELDIEGFGKDEEKTKLMVEALNKTSLQVEIFSAAKSTLRLFERNYYLRIGGWPFNINK